MNKQIFITLAFALMTGQPFLMAHHSGSTLSFSKQKPLKEKWTFKIIPSTSNTWGYDIYSNGKKIIHQPNKPGISGNSGFKTKKMAKSVAKKIIEKIKKGEMPPSITQEELDSLGAY